MPFPTRQPRVGRGGRPLANTHQPIETAKELESEHILSSIKFSKCDLQPHISRIPIRRVGSTDAPPTHDSKASPISKTSSSFGKKEESATMKVWKLIRPGLHRHLSLSGVSGKEGATQLAPQALVKKSTDRRLHYKGNAVLETFPERNETLQQVEETSGRPPPEPVNMYETATLCGEA